MSEDGWEIVPAGGVTGEAFFAFHNDEKLFLKRNSSPFLAVLSAEGIVPKLIWTKRLENGDVITAQHWISGRKLEPFDMSSEKVAKMLKKIHSSKPLLKMLRRIGKSPAYPEHLYYEIDHLLFNVKEDSTIKSALQFLKERLPSVKVSNWSVCHGDVHHNNWMMTEDNQLYLIDWDSATIGDPALDIGPLLYWYIPESEWGSWLKKYGLPLTNDFLKRMEWYVVYQSLLMFSLFHEKGIEEESRYWKEYLGTLL